MSHPIQSEFAQRREERLQRGLQMAADLTICLWALGERWWGRHRQRRALLELDDRLLDDIGISRPAAAREAGKWLWQ